MRTSVKSSQAQGAVPASGIPYPYSRLTKAQMVELLRHNISYPLTPEQFQRCAVASLYKWCDDVIEGRYASTVDLSNKLETLRDIYRNR